METQLLLKIKGSSIHFISSITSHLLVLSVTNMFLSHYACWYWYLGVLVGAMQPLTSLICTDMEGNSALWEAIKGGHETVMRILVENGAEISSNNVVDYARLAIEKNNLEILKEIIQRGGDVMQCSDKMTTLLHAAVCEGNSEIVKYLVELGADIDRQDSVGLTARSLAEHQCHEEILNIFNTIGHKNERNGIPQISTFVGRCQSEPTIPALPLPIKPPNKELTWFDNHQRRRVSPFHNSFFGIMSSANYGNMHLSFKFFYTFLTHIFLPLTQTYPKTTSS